MGTSFRGSAFRALFKFERHAWHRRDTSVSHFPEPVDAKPAVPKIVYVAKRQLNDWGTLARCGGAAIAG